DAYTFEDLFQGVKALLWGDILGEKDKFTITGKSVRSQLFSVSDCQAITKKAIVEKLKEKYHAEWFEETGVEYKIQVGILKDRVTIAIDTTGPGLNKRGYRENSVAAPLKETMAHALIDLSVWRDNRLLADPMCGSGTILIEAAMKSRNLAPGLKRSFSAENWPFIPDDIWKEARASAVEKAMPNKPLTLMGSDIDESAVEQARYNAEIAGVGDCIKFTAKPLSEFKSSEDYGVLISNPPYGERIGDYSDIEYIYKDIKRFLSSNGTWSVYLLTTNEETEKMLGRKADKKRKLYNGNIKTDYYQFLGPRPPRA
ncbi:MAG: class I SAM-dependent RNA methyltransferase, partial [Clostridiales bacterium]|nr:class I SAM-dependent RNA methyltransferase [Clostridiales bacterium]